MKNTTYSVNNELLKQYIERSGIKQRRIAEMLHITPASLCAKLAGKQPWQAIELYELCNIVGARPTEFLMLFVLKK